MGVRGGNTDSEQKAEQARGSAYDLEKKYKQNVQTKSTKPPLRPLLWTRLGGWCVCERDDWDFRACKDKG